MMRTIRNLTGLLFGVTLGIVMGLALIPKAKGATVARPSMVIIVAFEAGKPVAAQALTFSADLETCQFIVQQFLAVATPKDNIRLVGVCTPLPPAPLPPVT